MYSGDGVIPNYIRKAIQLQRWQCQKSMQIRLFYNYSRHLHNVWRYDLTSDLRFFWAFMKVKYINNCKVILGFKHMGLFLIYQEMCGLRVRTIWFSERGFLVLNAQAIFPGFCFLLELLFKKIKSSSHLLLNTIIANWYPIKFYHDITCCHNHTEDYGEEADQGRNRVGIYCKWKCWRDEVEHKGRKKQDDEEICGGMCPGCGGEEEIPISIQIRAEEIYGFLFSCVLIFKRGCWDGWASIKPSRKIRRLIFDYLWVSWCWRILHVWNRCEFICVLLFFMLRKYLRICWRTMCWKRDIWTWIRRRIPEWNTVGIRTGWELLMMARIIWIFMPWGGMSTQ